MRVGYRLVDLERAGSPNLPRLGPPRTAGIRAVITGWFRNFSTSADPWSADMDPPGLNIYT